MVRNPFHSLVALAACALVAAAVFGAGAEQPLVFVSAFAKGEQGAIYACALDVSTGALKSLQRTGGVENPFFMALSPERKVLYSVHTKEFGGGGPQWIAAYAVAGRTGELKLLNRQQVEGSEACHMSVDATGKALLVANYAGSVAALAIRADGSLGAAGSFIRHAGSSVDRERQEAPHAHSIVISPDNRFAYSADLGADRIVCYRLDAAKARLTPNGQPFVRTPPGAGPRHMAFHPKGQRLYVINELSNTITHFGQEPDTGLLVERETISTLPQGYKGTTYCADVKITPDGRFLYGTNRGHDSIAAYRIRDDGSLSLISIEPSLGKGPQNLAITPGGEMLVCANLPGNNVAVFRIDRQTGRLKSAGTPVSMTSPSCIMLVPR